MPWLSTVPVRIWPHLYQLYPTTLPRKEQAMSTVMYCYRIKRADWWSFFDGIREFYLENNILHKVLYNLEYAFVKHNSRCFVALSNLLENNATIELQLFEEPDGEHYLFRVLEQGYRFMNSYEEQGWPIEPVFYDTRTESSDAEKETLSDWVDKMICNHHYLVCSALSDTDFARILWEHARLGREK